MPLSCFRACWLNILPGTAIGLRYDWFVGFDLYEGSCFNSQGMPNRPNIFAPVSSVQEGPFPYLLFAGFQVSFVPNYWPEVVADPSRDPDYNPAGSPPPELNFRFSNLYLAAAGLSHHFWGGMVASCLYSPFFLPETSVSGNMFLQMRDCTLHGGWINLGEPDGRVIPPVFQEGWPEEWQPYCGPAIPGSVMLFNNLFDRVNINLDVDTGPFWWGGPYASPTMDLRVAATNNTFRGGYLYLEPINATAGNWVFENNLFDKTVFAQDQYQPLDYDYNAYWPCEGAELSSGQVAHFLPTTTGDGYTDGVYDGAHELKLTAPPPYAVGPLGHFYQSASSPLINKGNTTADQVGLYHYTTQVSQAKEAGSTADIGFHYAATASSSSQVPKDTDSDGIPDYVEDTNGDGQWDEGLETKTDSATTQTGVNDPLNTLYDDIDLDGDGMVGRIEKAFGKHPLLSENTLELTQVITDEEPDIMTFKVPVDFDLLSDLASLRLSVDGWETAFQTCERAEDGSCLLAWNTTFHPPYDHCVTLKLVLHDLYVQQGDMPDRSVLGAYGPIWMSHNVNVLQFNPVRLDFDNVSGGSLYASLPELEANYTIELRDPSAAPTAPPIKTYSQRTTLTGEISEHWDGIDDRTGQTFAGDSVDAVYNVTLLMTQTLQQHKQRLRRQPDPGSVRDGMYTVAYAWDNVYLAESAMRDCVQWGIVDTLLKPGTGTEEHYISLFNDFSSPGDPGDPGYLPDPSYVPPLRESLKCFGTRNFTFVGHGAETMVGNDKKETNPNFINISCADISYDLGNVASKHGLIRGHPFRLVVLDACNTADGHSWHNTFGIYERITESDLMCNPRNAQAFVGWKGSCRAPNTTAEWYDCALAYGVFYGAWMNGLTLDDCIDMSMREYPFPGNTAIVLKWPWGKKFPEGHWEDWKFYWKTYPNKFDPVVFGYAGITRSGFEYGHDNSRHYKK